ncbi:hypothetical protein DMC30DRAFT_418202 [Rhodotorula diobovata]|uniref:Uncharacterized protein n=1 Tax=Rhodotorula diobovata TaxID=5288 RepID=A0A5C5FQR9_9BASI|nr:hypothetical protein DMC30DRAFT_418202 [Rhodotorula diobovata]
MPDPPPIPQDPHPLDSLDPTQLASTPLPTCAPHHLAPSSKHIDHLVAAPEPTHAEPLDPPHESSHPCTSSPSVAAEGGTDTVPVPSSSVPAQATADATMQGEQDFEAPIEQHGSPQATQGIDQHAPSPLVAGAHTPLSTLTSADPSVASDLDEANATIARLRAELASLPAYYTSRNQLERDRLESDNLQLRTQAQVLARKVAVLEAERAEFTGKHQGKAGDKGKGKARADEADMQDEETGSQATEVDEQTREDELAELKAEKRALTADVFKLQDRLDVAETNTKRLSHELRSLRAYFLHGSPLVTLDHEVALPSPPASQTSPASSPRAKPRCVTLGDAEAELLLHAGKTLSHVHRVNRVPLSQAIADHAEDILAARDHGPYGLPLPPSLGGSGEDGAAGGLDGLDGLMQLANASSQEDPSGGGYGAAAARSSRRRRGGLDWAPVGHDDDDDDDEDVRLPVPPAQYNPYSLDPPPVAGGSGARASALGGADDPDYLPSPPPGLRAAVAGGGGGEGYGAGMVNPRQALGQRLSGLDVLAQATAEMGHHSQSLGVGVGFEAGDGAEASGSGTGRKKSLVPNGRSRVPAVGPDGEKKARSPYIKWNMEEDEQLLRAVIQVGCSWDNVAKLCPTRAYHQVRQRFLRGLRSGEQLPKQLMHLQEAVRKSVRDHEAKKKRKRLAKRAAQEITDSTRE